MKVRFHREPEVGRLHPEGPADPLNFRCHTALVLEGKQMLDHGVAERNVKAAIAELGKIGCVTSDRLDVLMPLLFGHEIQAGYLNIRPPGPTPVFPEGVLAAHIENPQRSGQRRHQRLKLPKPLGAKPVGKRAWALAVGQPPQYWNGEDHYQLREWTEGFPDEGRACSTAVQRISFICLPQASQFSRLSNSSRLEARRAR